MKKDEEIYNEIKAILGDKQWHSFLSILNVVGDKIMAERAVREYHGTTNGKIVRPIDFQVRMGRRRKVYNILRNLIRSRLAECKDLKAQPDYREYRLVDNPPTKRGDKKKESEEPCEAKKVNKKPAASVPDPAGEMSDALSKAEKMLCHTYKGTDVQDVKYHFRALRRIIKAPIENKS